MLNQLVLVGRYNGYTTKEGVGLLIELRVPRAYKNADGEYETDILYVKVSDNLLDNTKNYLKKGDLIGIKGHVESGFYEQDGSKFHRTFLIADKLTFLSSNPTLVKKDEDNSDGE
jgi:single-strand DNA-binding protein